jgi:hypothetical protein
MRGIAGVASIVLISSAAVAQPARITSAYTHLDLDKCEAIDRGEEPQSASWRCKGYAGISVFVQNGDDRYDVDAGREDADELWADGFDYPGETVEWRIAHGKPFAIIYRLNSANPDAPKWSRLMVETIGPEAHGCRVASIDANARNANAQARRAADKILSGTVRCLKP